MNFIWFTLETGGRELALLRDRSGSEDGFGTRLIRTRTRPTCVADDFGVECDMIATSQGRWRCACGPNAEWGAALFQAVEHPGENCRE